VEEWMSQVFHWNTDFYSFFILEPLNEAAISASVILINNNTSWDGRQGFTTSWGVLERS
jgi:hypothetical protein